MLLAALPHPILVLGPDERIIYANASAESFFSKFACTSAAAGAAVRGGGHLALDEACAGLLGRPPRRHHRALPDALDAMDLSLALERSGHLRTFDPERP